MPVQQLVAEILFVRTSYVKKIIEDCSNSEETVKLLRFSCWENPQFSSTVLSELLWQVNALWKDEQDIFYVSTRAKVPIICVVVLQVAYSYTYELRPYLDLLLQILLIEDSWQTHRSDLLLRMGVTRAAWFWMWSQFKFPLSLFGCIGSTMCLRAFQTTEMGFLTQSSAQRTTTRNEPTSASSVWWPCLATALWLTRSYRYAYIISHYMYM